MSDLILAARLQLDSQRWERGLTQAGAKTKGFTAGVKREFADLRKFADTTAGRLASLGVSVGVAAQVMKSAKIDQQLTLIKQTAGLTVEQTQQLRKELKGLSGETGIAFDSLMKGFGGLAAGGLNYDEALPTIGAINTAMRVTGEEADTLVSALQMAQTHFDFDLSKPEVALTLLEKMTVAGRLGVVEVGDLSAVFAASAANAKKAGLSFEETLAVYEGFGTATTKDRLGTLVNSTLAVFTDANYMRNAEKATGVTFFDAKGERRGALEVIADIKKKYDTLTTDRDRFQFVTKAFGQADKDTIIGITQALEGGNLQNILAIAEETMKAGGTFKRDFDESMDNGVAQANKLRERMGAVGDAFAQPVNSAFTRLSKFAMDKKDQGGLELSGGEVATAGAVSLAALYAGGKMGKGLLGKLSGGAASLGGGVMAGQALEKAGLAAPVFVVGAAPGVFSGVGLPAAIPVADGGKGGWKGALGFSLPTALASSMLLDPRNQELGKGIPELSAKWKAENEAKGGHWMTRGGLPSFNFISDLIDGFKKDSATDQQQKLAIDVNLKVEGGQVTVSAASGDLLHNVTTRRSVPNLGRMMGPPSVVN
ncbi:phage tail tape measure protein [Pseudoxanthomonas sp. UTMC 1351]|uniref:phage tail tape measure protein n=1 Tax=Pseudoxanthomonas sp. UTMC 1351 TaxID=2695853 RepID=UPI0034D010B0